MRNFNYNLCHLYGPNIGLNDIIVAVVRMIFFEMAWMLFLAMVSSSFAEGNVTCCSAGRAAAGARYPAVRAALERNANHMGRASIDQLPKARASERNPE